MTETESTHEERGIFIHAIGHQSKPYPAWRYHKWLEPQIVHNTDEDEELQAQGYAEAEATIEMNTYLLNWRHDLEEMSARQLSLFLKEEFELDIPYQVGKEYLFQLIWKLYMFSPASKDQIALIAEVVELNYDKAQSGIKEIAEGLDDFVKEEFYG